MSRTVDRIGDQLTMRNLFNALLDKADENEVDARYLVEGARKNPIALGLIAAGAIWLVSDKDSRFPTFKSGKGSDRWTTPRRTIMTSTIVTMSRTCPGSRCRKAKTPSAISAGAIRRGQTS